jgi:hypothetical protein
MLIAIAENGRLSFVLCSSSKGHIREMIRYLLAQIWLAEILEFISTFYSSISTSRLEHGSFCTIVTKPCFFFEICNKTMLIGAQIPLLFPETRTCPVHLCVQVLCYRGTSCAGRLARRRESNCYHAASCGVTCPHLYTMN